MCREVEPRPEIVESHLAVPLLPGELLARQRSGWASDDRRPERLVVGPCLHGARGIEHHPHGSQGVERVVLEGRAASPSALHHCAAQRRRPGQRRPRHRVGGQHFRPESLAVHHQPRERGRRHGHRECPRRFSSLALPAAGVRDSRRVMPSQRERRGQYAQQDRQHHDADQPDAVSRPPWHSGAVRASTDGSDCGPTTED
jgi:hypothetical protein